MQIIIHYIHSTTIYRTVQTIFFCSFNKIKLSSSRNQSVYSFTFRDQFLAMVHNNVTFDNATRFYYLNQFLDVEPARVIAGIPQTGDNYHGAWEHLNERYENVRVLLDAHFKKFFDLAPLRNESTQGMLDFVDITNEMTRSLPVPVFQWLNGTKSSCTVWSASSIQPPSAHGIWIHVTHLYQPCARFWVF